MIFAFHMSWGTDPSCQHRQNSLWRCHKSSCFPHWITSAGMLSFPGALLWARESVVLLISSSIGDRSNSSMVGRAGVLSRPVSETMLLGGTGLHSAQPTTPLVCSNCWWPLHLWTPAMQPYWCWVQRLPSSPNTYPECYHCQHSSGCSGSSSASSTWCSILPFSVHCLMHFSMYQGFCWGVFLVVQKGFSFGLNGGFQFGEVGFNQSWFLLTFLPNEDMAMLWNNVPNEAPPVLHRHHLCLVTQ